MLRQPPISTLLPIPTLCRSCARPGTSSRVPPAWGVGTTLVTRQLGAAPLVSRGACRDAERLTVERVSAPPGTPDQPGELLARASASAPVSPFGGGCQIGRASCRERV